MAMPDKERLRSIKTFPSLVKYLRDELDWPIESEDFEELTFDYAPEELGLDAQTAVKIKEVKQLRPLVSNQPWGIFFVNFEPKRLPVVVLRRILRSLVLKKRQSSNKAQQAAWQLHDLLFISSYGEAEHRDITFAHFAEEQELGDLPTLRVLGWDDEDTALHLEYADRELREKLRWPANASDLNVWRRNWSAAFKLRHQEVIATSKELATHLADLAMKIRKRANAVLRVESETGPFRRLYAAFRESLVHDLSEDDFADMYAQTISYGLLTARVSRPAGLVAENLQDMVPGTNPFLKDLLEAFLTAGGRKGKIDFDELGVSEVVQMLRDARMEDVLRDFGDKNPQEDPAIHFYELFLKEYDPEKRMKRGVFYTPRPVVSFIVRSVNEILQKEFGLVDGLADITSWGELAQRHKDLKMPDGVSPEEAVVQVLDPATGTGTFLVEVIDIVHKTMLAKWTKAGHMSLEFQNLWNEYVPKHLLPRLHGFELMMAPYAIAHMKIGLKLHETGYRFTSSERTRIFLTNALEPPTDDTKQRKFEEWVPALAHEAKAVNAVKQKQHFTVVIGNPPYAGHSVNNHIASIVELVYDYKRGLPELERPGQAKWLQDDYVKFIRFAERTLEVVPAGVLGYISNHSYLDNPTFKGMRRHILNTFTNISIIDLHGNMKKKERTGTGAIDENVFDIQQGVAILLARRGTKEAGVRTCDLFGVREEKYKWLEMQSVLKTKSQPIAPVAPMFFFRMQDRSLASEYEAGLRLPEIMSLSGEPAPGVVTTHDEFAISWTRAEAAEKVAKLLKTKSEEQARSIFTLCSQSQWNYERAKSALADGSWRKQIIPILYRPFDMRWTVFNPHVAVHRRERVMRHMLGGRNVGLICTRQTKDEWGVLVANQVVAHKTCGAYDINFLFPLYVLPTSEEARLHSEAAPLPNISQGAAQRISAVLGVRFDKDKGLPEGITPEDIFNYAYGVFHSPEYRRRYAEFLKIDFPRLPLPRSLHMFRALSGFGRELVAFHLLESPRLNRRFASYAGRANPEVEKISYDRNTVWINKAYTCGFQNVPEAVWRFHVGGYQVCEKWLKDRKGNTLSADDVRHYDRVVGALTETIHLMAEIDKVIETHGGWPGAFIISGT
jgi:predicted helicase